MSCFPQPELSHNPSISKTSQPNVLKPDIRSVLSVPRAPGSVLPFPGDVHNFAPKLDDVMSALYGLPYGSSPSLYPGIPTAAVGPNPFYNLNPADRKDLPNMWRNPPPTFSPYDRSLSSLFYAGGFPHLTMADGVRGRKNATRETTSVLKSWLDEHKKNPYPTKAEKVLLAVMAKMSLTQVSTWFANARRRLKKENKMTWPPRNCCGDERDSGEETADRSFSISPRDHDNGLENRRLSPTKDVPTSPHLPEMSSSAASSDIPCQQYHQQLLLPHLSSLPSHLRIPEAIKQVQKQLQLRSLWAATAASEAESQTSVQNYVTPAKISGANDEKMQQERRNSVGSPSTSSYDRSPSPLHRPLQSTWVPPTIPNQPTSFRKSASVSDSPSDALKIQDDSNVYRPRTKSNEENFKVKSSIWSPVSMVSDKSPIGKQTLLSDNKPNGSDTTSVKIEDRLKTLPHSNGRVTESANISRSAFLQKAKLSPSAESANYHASMAAQAYIREYHRHLASQTSMQHGLSSLMMPMPLDKTQSAAQSQLIEQLQRNQNLQTQLLFSKDVVKKESPCQRNVDSEVEIPNNNDTPMNLSKSSRSLDGGLLLNLKEKKDFALKTDSVGATTV